MGRDPQSQVDLGVLQELMDAHEASTGATERRARGLHYTSLDLAALLACRAVDMVEEQLGRLPDTVCDPSCGGGAFLVAVAEELVARGLDPVDVVENRLVGFDVDPDAVEIARRVLATWLRLRSSSRDVPDDDAAVTPTITCRDVLDPQRLTEIGEHDLVIGNPPFLTQLRSSTALGSERMDLLSERLGPLHPYVDASAVFLLIGMRSVTDGGVVCMIQPQSFLSNASAESVRDTVVDSDGPLQLWSSPRMLFDASVRTCAVLVAPGGKPDPEVVVRWSDDRRSIDPTLVNRVRRPGRRETWGYMIAPALGIPDVARLAAGGPRRGAGSVPVGVLGELAETTAGFRDEYYVLRDACLEQPPTAYRSPYARLITSGMIRPGGSDWGRREVRIGGTAWSEPVVDPMALETVGGRVARWVSDRLVPKVLVATQSRVVEAVADPSGEMIPMTPVISVEPREGWEMILDPMGDHGVDIWWLVAALTSPSVSAEVLTANLGSGLSMQSLRWSARSVAKVALPVDIEHWALGADAARGLHHCDEGERSTHLRVLGEHMLAAHQLDQDEELFDWWFDRACRA